LPIFQVLEILQKCKRKFKVLFYSGYGYAYGGYPYSYGARFIGKRSTDAEPEAGVQNYGAYELYFLFV
jgi:hypothetical protein